MTFNGSRILSVLLVCFLNEASGHSCLNFHHVKDFDLAQFSGRWYAIQTTSPQSRCLVYDFKIQKKTKNIENINCVDCINCKNCVDCKYCENCEDLVGCGDCEDSENLVNCNSLKKSKGSSGCDIGSNVVDCSNCRYVYHCKNVHDCIFPQYCTNIKGLNFARNIHKVIPVKHQFIEALKTDRNSPSKLSVSTTQTPDVPEKSPFVVFTTDYQSYAGVYFCRKTANGQKHSVAILSRSQDVDKEKLDSLIEYINYHYVGVNFSIVAHTDCNHPDEAYDANSSVQNVIGDDEKVDIHISFMSTEDKPEIP